MRLSTNFGERPRTCSTYKIKARLGFSEPQRTLMNLLLEAASRFELENGGFADLCLTTWLCRLMQILHQCLLSCAGQSERLSIFSDLTRDNFILQFPCACKLRLNQKYPSARKSSMTASFWAARPERSSPPLLGNSVQGTQPRER